MEEVDANPGLIFDKLDAWLDGFFRLLPNIGIALVVLLILIGLVKALRWDPLMVYRHNQRYRNDAEADHAMPPELPGELFEQPQGTAAAKPAE